MDADISEQLTLWFAAATAAADHRWGDVDLLFADVTSRTCALRDGILLVAVSAKGCVDMSPASPNPVCRAAAAAYSCDVDAFTSAVSELEMGGDGHRVVVRSLLEVLTDRASSVRMSPAEFAAACCLVNASSLDS